MTTVVVVYAVFSLPVLMLVGRYLSTRSLAAPPSPLAGGAASKSVGVHRYCSTGEGARSGVTPATDRREPTGFTQ